MTRDELLKFRNRRQIHADSLRALRRQLRTCEREPGKYARLIDGRRKRLARERELAATCPRVPLFRLTTR